MSSIRAQPGAESVRAMRRIARGDGYNDRAQRVIARYQRRKRHPQRVLNEKRAAVERARRGMVTL